jgi:3-phenylpropionate/trans-cinnamate dioxygenase ferredoxin reductase subunit
MNIETIVIVGAGQAGGWAAHTLRKEGFAGRIVLVGDESHPPHERPPLSKAVLAGEATPESTQLFKAEGFERLALEWRPGVAARSIDRVAKVLVLADGSSVRYDKLILCTGGRARLLDVPGAELPGIRALRTIDDALALRPVLRPGQTILVVGGGWIGLEVAATARTQGAEVIVIEAASRLCERTVPAEVSEYLLALHRARGAQILLGATVAGFERLGQGRMRALLRDGRTLEGDSIVVGVGLVPNDELARAAGLECDAGVVVDERCRSSDPDILAAGDVAVAHNAWTGRRMRLESWQNAQEQGIAAARSALGLAVDTPPLPWFWSDQYDMNLQIHGIPATGQQVVMRGRPETGSFLLFYLDGGRVQAALGPNAARDLRFARRLIERRTPVNAQVLADPAVPLARL